MSRNAQDIDKSIKLILEKLSEEFEIVKRQGFPARKNDLYSRHSRPQDVRLSEYRWRAWSEELGMDYTRFEGILKIIEKEGFLEDYKFSPDYI